MKLWKVAATVAVGVWASASGSIQVDATSYAFFVDFSTKEVADFDDYRQNFSATTNDLGNNLQYTLNTFYNMSSCTPNLVQNVRLEVRYQLNGTGTAFGENIELPDMNCTTFVAFYQITGSITIPTEHLAYILDDDANYLSFRPTFLFYNNAASAGRVITLTDFQFVLTTNYDFNTTYLFNYFLSDAQLAGVSFYNAIESGTRITDFDYVMTTAGNDTYFLINSATTNYGTTRTKWAIDYEEEYFRGDSIGSRYKLIQPNISITNVTTDIAFVQMRFNYYYLNAANKNQDIANVSTFEFEEEDCGWDAFNIPCFINNGLAYIVNDAPVISDAFTLLNAGMRLGGQAFGIIGNFNTDNLFGVMILGGLGITAVRWFLKND
jgi:hypothetical protein